MILIVSAIFTVSFCLFVCAYGISRWVLLKDIDRQLVYVAQHLRALDAATRDMSERLPREKRDVHFS